MIRDTPQSGDKVTEKGIPTERFQALLESIELALNAPRVPSFTVATVPTVTESEARIIYVSDETGGATLAFSDGINWFRVQDRAIIS